MRAAGLLLGIAGLAGLAVAGLAMRPGLVPPPNEGRATAQAEATVDTSAIKAVVDLPPVPERVRPISPNVVAAPQVDVSALERVRPRDPLSPLGRAQTKADLPPKKTLLHRPHAIAAGTFSSMGHVVQLAGIAKPDPDEQCEDDGVTWTCGVHGRTAFRNWLRGRALSCVVPALPGKEVVVTDCVMGKLDPAEWLVTYGWARAAPDGPYAALEALARSERRGLFGPAPGAVAPAALNLPELPAFDRPASAILEPEPSGG